MVHLISMWRPTLHVYFEQTRKVKKKQDTVVAIAVSFLRSDFKFYALAI